MGADSGISFNSAVRALKTTSPQVTSSKSIIPGLEIVRLPVAGSKDSLLSQRLRLYRLPPMELLQQHAARYFAQVHCQHWLYSSEDFHARLQASYSNASKTPTSSWLCSLYCIFTLGALGSPSDDEAAEWQSTDITLDIAKSLVPQVCDEADLDSIRALFLLVSLQIIHMRMRPHRFTTNIHHYSR